MICGIGVDAVTISELKRLLEGPDDFASYTFSERERSQATMQTAQKLAGCFAAKEAVFKAVAHLIPDKTFDFRFVELLRDKDGSPFIASNEVMADVLESAGVNALHVSLTSEQDMVLAFVVAESGT
ncbi:holo-ACP synthase [Adlercreutzia sp. R21]|uniref:holo-ACP synthase n=1 Tax=Adlercreutzia wanghongyangiae TaxID=3111451 RepID=UPI002DBCF439|nr:holo-ACP synthase [Adlercreutzia sp. R21]MEC4185250.1 holo-ACP synthase [Adlercreutzia sp. R21]